MDKKTEPQMYWDAMQGIATAIAHFENGDGYFGIGELNIVKKSTRPLKDLELESFLDQLELELCKKSVRRALDNARTAATRDQEIYMNHLSEAIGLARHINENIDAEVREIKWIYQRR